VRAGDELIYHYIFKNIYIYLFKYLRVSRSTKKKLHILDTKYKLWKIQINITEILTNYVTYNSYF
jgi:hypothetical protein